MEHQEAGSRVGQASASISFGKLLRGDSKSAILTEKKTLQE